MALVTAGIASLPLAGVLGATRRFRGRTGVASITGGGTVTTYVNRVFDTVAATFVRWETTTQPDALGTQYPGPGVFGVDTSDYCVETIK